MGNETEIMTVPLEHVQGYMDFGGSVNGNDTHNPHVVHFKDRLEDLKELYDELN